MSASESRSEPLLLLLLLVDHARRVPWRLRLGGRVRRLGGERREVGDRLAGSLHLGREVLLSGLELKDGEGDGGVASA